jgi:hypothetical protein
MMGYSAANLTALYRLHSELRAKVLEDAQRPTGFEVVETPSGSPTARLQGTYLHSRYDPIKEARRIVKKEVDASASACIVLGFGFGYLVEAFCEAFPSKPLVVVEQDTGLFLQALKARDLRNLLSLPNIHWHLGDEPEAVMMSVEALPLQQLCVLRLRPLLASRSEYYHRVEVLLFSVIDKREVNINTLSRFGQLWVRNLLRNIDHFTGNPGISVVKNRFSGVPAMVIAAGPSLDELLPHLKTLQEHMLIVAVDTSYRFCKNQGVEPDFLVSVDPQYWNSRHLDWLEREQTVLVSESSAHPRIFRSRGNKEEMILFVSSFFPLGKFIEEIIGERGLIGAGGSVATTAWDVCRYLGCPSIYMAGLDLGFPGKRTHSRGAFFEESMHNCSCRLLTAEQMTFRYLHQAVPTALANNQGGRTLTDRRMLIYKWWFENQMKQQSQTGGPSTFTLAAGGIAIDGMGLVEVTEIFELPKWRSRIDAELSDLRREKEGRDNRHGQVRQNLQRLAVELEKLQVLAKRGIELCDSDYGSGGSVAGLAKVDQDILSLASRQIAGFLFQPLIRRILDNPEGPRDYAQALATSRQLYDELLASASYHSALLHKSLERL